MEKHRNRLAKLCFKIPSRWAIWGQGITLARRGLCICKKFSPGLDFQPIPRTSRRLSQKLVLFLLLSLVSAVFLKCKETKWTGNAGGLWMPMVYKHQHAFQWHSTLLLQAAQEHGWLLPMGHALPFALAGEAQHSQARCRKTDGGHKNHMLLCFAF